MNQLLKSENSSWKEYEKWLFRFFFLFIGLLIIPIDSEFWKNLISINLLDLHFYDLFRLARYVPQFFDVSASESYGIGSFATFGILALVALAGTIIWSKLKPDVDNYNRLYYLLRVAVRYRLAIALIAYGFIKFFPLQMPYPSLSNLHTNYGDYFAWKIYFQTVGIAPKYEAFLGFVEILAGFLLFYRKTVTFAVGLVFGFLGNVAVANGFYDIGEQVFSTYLVFLAVFLFTHDIPRLYDMLILEKTAKPNRLAPVFNDNNLRKIRSVLQGAFLCYVFLFGYKSYSNYKEDPYKVPKTPGLSKAYGFYNVKQFVINGDTLPYSTTDPKRWQNVIFEKWSTLSIKVNRPVKVDFSSGEKVAEHDIDRNYEIAGYAGRHYFYYEADTVNHKLALQNKNKNHRQEKMQLSFKRPNDSTIVLNGTNENNEKIQALLTKVNKKYMMLEGRRKPVKI